jgi:hypothetical protein
MLVIAGLEGLAWHNVQPGDSSDCPRARPAHSKLTAIQESLVPNSEVSEGFVVQAESNMRAIG